MKTHLLDTMSINITVLITDYPSSPRDEAHRVGT